MRRCGRCKRTLPLAEFGRFGTGAQSYCRACKKEYDAAWYQANKAKRRDKVNADRRDYIAWLDTLKKGKPCSDCGRSYPS